jgi:hypothetical protein
MAPMKQPTASRISILALAKPHHGLTFEDRDNGTDHVRRWVIERLVEGWCANQSTHESIVITN